jgi:hypothetical protein
MTAKILYWVPRILTILAILFMMMFSLDMIGENIPLGKKLLGLLIHNIPALILAGILVVAWKNELIGGLLFIVAFIAASIFFRSFAGNPGSFVVIIPFMITGILFILHSRLYGRKG